MVITVPSTGEEQVSTPSSSRIPTKALQHEKVFAVSIFFFTYTAVKIRINSVKRLCWMSLALASGNNSDRCL